MSSFVFNVARGRIRYYYDAVDSSFVITQGVYTSTANAALLVVAIDAAGTTDDALRDFDDLAALLAGTPNEATNSGYARKVLDDTILAAAADPDTINVVNLDFPDQTWTGVAAGTNWTDIITGFRPDTTSPDSAIIPLTCHDYVRIPNGTDITIQIDPFGFYGSED